MAYIGNTQVNQNYVAAIDYFSGNDSTTAFTLSRPVASVAQVQVVIENVPQNPGDAYTVNGNTITFTSAPPSGTNNIYIYYTSPNTQVVALPQSPIVYGNLNFGSTGARIQGDFSNATLANRLAFQTSTVDSATGIIAYPNGTSQFAGWYGFTSTSANASYIGFSVDGTNTNIVSDRTGTGTYLPMTFYTGGSERMRIDTSGNVGIGTSSPSAKLHVSSGATTITGASSATARINMFNNAATTGGFLLGQGYTSGTDNTGYVFNTANAPIAFGTNDIERMRIDSSGAVLMGCTTIPNVGASPQQYGTSTSSTEVVISKNITTGFALYMKTAGGNNGAIGFWNGTSQVGAINTTTTTTAYVTSSDYRLKENVQPMVGALDVVAQLNPVTYNWKVDGSDGQGFIAHELQAVVPDCVTGEKDAVDDEGNPVYQGVDTSFLVATLTKAIQELKAIVDEQAEKIKALEAK